MGSHVPWGPGYGYLGGSWGPFRWLETGFVGWGSNQQKSVLAATGRHRQVFDSILAHRDRVRVAQLSYPNDVGWFFEKIKIYWVLEGFGHLEKFRGTNKKKIGPEKIEKHVEIFFSVAVSKKYVFVKNGAIFFPFSALGAP